MIVYVPLARLESENAPLLLVVVLTEPVLTVTPPIPVPLLVVIVPETAYVVLAVPQSSNLKFAMRVFQLPGGRYMPTIQNVQSSDGSTTIE